jgi:hypothetical protein
VNTSESQSTFIYWLTSYGQGWGSQIVATLGTGASAYLTPEGDLKTNQSWNLGGGVAINLTDKWVTNLSVNAYAMDPPESRDPLDMVSGESAHINLMWSPYKKVNTGIEYMYLRRTNMDDSQGTGSRLQLMVKYLF